MKTKLVFFALFILLLGSNAWGQTFHLILIADTKDPKIGRGCEIDHWTFYAKIKEVTEALNLPLNEVIISKDNFNFTNVNTAINNLSCAPEDVIFFYYSGHGFNTADRQSDWPVMNLKSNDGGYPLELAYKNLKQKGARLCIVLGDLCNEVTTDIVASLESKGLVVEEISQANPAKIYSNLFTQHSGDILIASSSRGQYAWSTKYGSFYTQSFIEALTNAANYNANITWETMLADTQNRLYEAMSKLGKKQDPKIELKVSMNAFVDTTGGFRPISINKNENTTIHSKEGDTTKIDKPIPIQSIGYNEINQYLNSLINNTIKDTERLKYANNCSKYFMPRAKVKIYTNKVYTDLQPIEDYVKQKVLNNNKIVRINFIENLSKFNYNENKYFEIAVQEIWKNE